MAEPVFTKMLPRGGATLSVDQVFGREEQARAAFALLDRGQNLLLDEPRRFGKSSFLDVLRDQPPSGWTVVKVSLQGRTTEMELATALLGAIDESTIGARAKAALGMVFDRIGELGPVKLKPGFEADPITTLEKALERLDAKLGEHGGILVIACDEVTEMVQEIGSTQSTEAARKVLATLRRFREEHRHIRWVLAGSIGFHHVQRMVGATDSMTNNLYSFSLGPLPSDLAGNLAGNLMLGIGITQGGEPAARARRDIAAASDGIPILIHTIVDDLDKSGVVDPAGIDATAVLDRCFRRTDSAKNLTHLLSRVDTYYRDEAPIVEDLLDAVATSELNILDAIASVAGLSKRDGTRLIGLLERDHYLEQSVAGLLRWRYPSLARLWRIRRGIMS